MSEAQVKPVWDGYTRDQLRPWLVQSTQEAQDFYKGIQGKPDMPERLPFLETKYKEIEAATTRLQQLDNAHVISERLAAQMKSLSEPAEGGIAFDKSNPNPEALTASASVKSFGEAVATAPAVKSIGNFEDHRGPLAFTIPDFMFQSGMKTVMSTTAGYAPANPRTNVVVPYAQRDPRLADYIPVKQTDLRTINYMEETTALAGTNAQVSIAEGSLKFENALAFTARSAAVETIATWLPVTTQQLDDVAGLQGIIQNRMDLFLRLKEEDLLLNGTGTTPQLVGFQGAAASSVLSQARGTDTNIDAIFKAIQQIRVTGLAEPDVVLMHPDNFTPIALYKATTGEYGFSVTVDNAGVTRLWGKPLVLSPVATSGTALVGAFREYSEIWRKMGMNIQIGLNSDDFTKNKRTILGEFREALAIYRQTAFCKVTGLQ